MLLGTLNADLLAGRETNRPGERIIRAGCGSEKSSIKKSLIPSHPLANLEISE